MRDNQLVERLAPSAERLLHRHLAASKEWFPHELVPWNRGRDFDRDDVWDPSEYPVPDGVRSALFLNLLTEDNLPYYFGEIDKRFRGGPWDEWARRWTAEEGRHAIVIRDYLTVTRAVDPVALERARMAQVSTGEVPRPPGVADTLVYVALQELATRIAHRNTGKLLEDPAGYEVMARVAADENHHFLFYRDVVADGIEIDPSTFVLAISRQVADFEMPGTGIVDFKRHAMSIARSGVYDLSIHHDQVLAPVVLRSWGLESLTGLSDEAEAARDATLAHMARVDRLGRRAAARREKAGAAA